MSSSSPRTAVSHPTSVAIDSHEDSDELEDTINVAVDLSSSESLPPRGTRARTRLEAVDSSEETLDSEEAVDSSDETLDSEEAPESSDDVIVLDNQPPAPTSSANLNRTAKRKRTVPPPLSTPHLVRS